MLVIDTKFYLYQSEILKNAINKIWLKSIIGHREHSMSYSDCASRIGAFDCMTPCTLLSALIDCILDPESYIMYYERYIIRLVLTTWSHALNDREGN